MFRWFQKRRSDPTQDDLRRRHLRLLEEARDLQRGGDIRGFADKTAEAEAVERLLDAAEAASGGSDEELTR